MEMDGIVAKLSALPELAELHALDLEGEESLPRNRMTAEIVVRAGIID
jgi:hypothetical protein